ncbi:dUTP diphosphatase [Listeria booriae]|uniref:dUTP diphosphatase n=1 Tax=Listeria booriae TaxID=1552123 RepID=UPI00162636BF|nr:dUTP diphosphatase [Listeria booriae]MBC2173976.1 hypothetical protein [Listeria booriae]
MDIREMQRKQKEADELKFGRYKNYAPQLRNVMKRRDKIKVALLVETGVMIKTLGWCEVWKEKQKIDQQAVKASFAHCIALILAWGNIYSVVISSERLQGHIDFLMALKPTFSKGNREDPEHQAELFTTVLAFLDDKHFDENEVQGLLHQYIAFGILSLRITPEEIEKNYLEQTTKNIEAILNESYS